MAWWKTILGILVGVFVAGLVIAGVEMIGHSTLRGDAVFAAAVIGYGLGACVGTAVCSKVAGGRPAITVPVLLGVLALINLLSFPHPSWFAIAATASLALGGWVGGRLAIRFNALGTAEIK
jgi:hypothetical protein